MLDAAGLIEKHKGKGVLVDTNLLVLFLIGLVNSKRIGTFKRTQSFGPEDFDVLSGLIQFFGLRLVATPYVLSQVSDLTDLKGAELSNVRKLLKTLVEKMDEHYDTARNLVLHSVFPRHGLADASVAAAHSTGILMLTADLRLYLALQEHGLESLNFDHVRQLGWQ